MFQGKTTAWKPKASIPVASPLTLPGQMARTQPLCCATDPGPLRDVTRIRGPFNGDIGLTYESGCRGRDAPATAKDVEQQEENAMNIEGSRVGIEGFGFGELTVEGSGIYGASNPELSKITGAEVRNGKEVQFVAHCCFQVPMNQGPV